MSTSDVTSWKLFIIKVSYIEITIFKHHHMCKRDHNLFVIVLEISFIPQCIFTPTTIVIKSIKFCRISNCTIEAIKLQERCESM